MRQLKQIILREMFMPTFFGIFINPFYIIRQGLYKAIMKNKKYLSGKMLDFGCGEKPYQEIIDVQEYVGVDIKESGHNPEDKKADIYYDGVHIPVKDSSFDSVLAVEVFEHVFNLQEVLSEIQRVMKSGGYLVATFPFVWDEHEVPYDFARYTSFGAKHIFKEAGFEIIKLQKTTGYVETVFQMWNAYIFQHVFPKNERLKMILTPLFVAPVTILGIFLSKILPKNKGFYHNNIIIVRKK